MSRELPGAVNATSAARHAEMLGGRVKKTFKKLHKQFDREGIGAFRLYDRDIPEVRAVVDWYEGHLVVGEYARAQTTTVEDWLGQMAQAAAAALGVPSEQLHLKRRRTRPREGARYSKVSEGQGPSELSVRERGLRFRVNLDDYLDTGLFPDHRESRRMVRSEAAGCSVLNLFGYTGSFSVAALAGGAKHVTTVELSKTYLDWTAVNLRENALPLARHEPARGEVFDFLRHAVKHGRRWHLLVVDPPSFSTAGGPVGGGGFDIRRDHPALIELCLRATQPGGQILFSTNHQRFGEPAFPPCVAEEITDRTVPRDYRNRTVHRAWRLRPGTASPSDKAPA